MNDPTLSNVLQQKYQHGFITDIESDAILPGLTEDTVRLISSKKNEPEFLLEWRLKAFRHWQTMKPPTWAQVKFPDIDFQKIIY